MFSVIGMDGQVYGPVDVATLQRWCAEGRVGPTSTVIDARDGRQMYAQSVDVLTGCFSLQTTTYAQPPSPYAGTAYPRSGYGAVGLSPKSKTAAILWALFLGGFGAHRFYLGHTSTGAVMLLLAFGGCLCQLGWLIVFIWSIIDIILIATDSLVAANGQRLS